jgi:hypothetical protein
VELLAEQEGKQQRLAQVEDRREDHP